MNAPSDLLDRRRFLTAALAGVGLLALRSMPLPGRLAPAGTPAFPAARLATLFAHAPSTHAIGRVYLRQVPAEGDVPTLARLIAASLSTGPAALARMSDAALRHGIAQRIRQDFADGRIVDVDGWLLSVTEARLYAVTTLVGAA